MTEERWGTFSWRDQVGHIGAELARAAQCAAIDADAAHDCLERALALTDNSLHDARWRKNPLPWLRLRMEIARAYAGELERISFVNSIL